MMSMFAAPNQKSDDSEEEMGHGGGMRPVVETAPGEGTMDCGGGGHGNDDHSHVEEEDALELQ